MKNYLVANRQTYDQTANEFQTKAPQRLEADKDIIERFLQRMPHTHPTVLDLGPGSGQMAQLLSDQQAEVVAIEISPKMAELAQKRAPKAHIICDEFLHHNFMGQKFDAILGFAFVHLFDDEDLSDVMQKIYNLLDPGGLLVLSTTKHPKSFQGYKVKSNFASNSFTRFRREFTQPEFRQLVEHHGFKIVSEGTSPSAEVRDKTWIEITAQKPA